MKPWVPKGLFGYILEPRYMSYDTSIVVLVVSVIDYGAC